MSDNIATMVRNYVVAKLLQGDGRGLTDDTDLVDSALLDSFAVLELVAFLQRTFQVRIPLAKINATNLQNIAAISRLVRKARTPCDKDSATSS